LLKLKTTKIPLKETSGGHYVIQVSDLEKQVIPSNVICVKELSKQEMV
jgi:hypothetical protein